MNVNAHRDAGAGQVEEGREQIYQRVEGEDLDALGDAGPSDDEGHAGGRLERHHLVCARGMMCKS